MSVGEAVLLLAGVDLVLAAVTLLLTTVALLLAGADL